jgi:hypothetical protein
MVRRSLLLLLIILSQVSIAQRIQGALRVDYVRTMFNHKGSDIDPSSFKFVEQFASGFGAIFHYRLDTSWALTSGFGAQYRKYKLLHEPVKFQDLSQGSLYLKTLFGAFEIPVLIRYQVPVSNKFVLSASTGIVISNFGLNRSAVGYSSLQYEGTDSLNYEIEAGGTYTKRFSLDPYLALGFEKVQGRDRIFGINFFYQYSLVNSPDITYHAKLFNSTTSQDYTASIKGNFSIAGIALTYYPSWLNFRKSSNEDEEDFVE